MYDESMSRAIALAKTLNNPARQAYIRCDQLPAVWKLQVDPLSKSPHLRLMHVQLALTISGRHDVSMPTFLFCLCVISKGVTVTLIDG